MISKAVAFILSVQAAFSSAMTLTDEGEYKFFEGNCYMLSFEDNFEGTELDPTKWEKAPEWHRQDLNNYWCDDMSYLDGEGNLILEMSYDSEKDRFNSGAVQSEGLFEQTCGYFEIRCTLNNKPGYWTAFWLMSDDVMSEINGGKDGTEIDIYESPFHDKKQIQHTLNWDGYGKMHKSEGKVVNADVYDGQYHTFGLIWTEKEYVYFIDGEETWRTDAKKARGTCEVPLYMIISAETGGWTDIPDPEALPDSIKVDYVRVYGKRE